MVSPDTFVSTDSSHAATRFLQTWDRNEADALKKRVADVGLLAWDDALDVPVATWRRSELTGGDANDS